MDSQKFLSLEEVVSLLGISSHKFSEMVDAGQLLQPLEWGKRTLRWSQEDLKVMEFLLKNPGRLRKSTSEEQDRLAQD